MNPSQSPHKQLAHLTAFAPEPIVFFTIVTAQRRAVLANREVHEILRGVWERSSKQNGWWVGDYLLMPDHVHFFARASRTADRMQKWIQMWKSVSARVILKQQELTPPFWQKDYFDRYLRSTDQYSEKWSYVEDNPIRAGLVKTPEDWPYRGCIHSLML